MKNKKSYSPERIINLYKKGLSLSNIQNLIGCPTEIASKIVKEAGLFNPKRQHDFFAEQIKNKRTD